MKIVLMGDRDTALGFKLAGVHEVYSFEETSLENKRALSKDEYFKVIMDLMLQAVRELGEEKIRVSSNETTLQLVAEKIDEIKAFLKENTGMEISIELGDKIETIGGVLVENADRTIRVDNTFEARIERLESELRSRIAKVLFG